jgi:hypothetical protein
MSLLSTLKENGSTGNRRCLCCRLRFCELEPRSPVSPAAQGLYIHPRRPAAPFRILERKIDRVFEGADRCLHIRKLLRQKWIAICTGDLSFLMRRRKKKPPRARQSGQRTQGRCQERVTGRGENRLYDLWSSSTFLPRDLWGRRQIQEFRQRPGAREGQVRAPEKQMCSPHSETGQTDGALSTI